MLLSDSLVTHLKLEENTGTRVDQVGGNNFAAVNSPGSTTGVIGDCLRAVTSSGSHLIRGINDDFQFKQDRDQTFALWIKLHTGVTLNRGVFGSWGSGNNFYVLNISSLGPRFGFYISNTLGTVYGASTEGLITLGVGVWYFLAGGFDSDLQQVWLRVNEHPRVSSNFVGTMKTGTRAVTLGNYQASASGLSIDADIDEFSWWHRNVSELELDRIYGGGNAPLAFPWESPWNYYRQLMG